MQSPGLWFPEVMLSVMVMGMFVLVPSGGIVIVHIDIVSAADTEQFLVEPQTSPTGYQL